MTNDLVPKDHAEAIALFRARSSGRFCATADRANDAAKRRVVPGHGAPGGAELLEHTRVLVSGR